MGPRRRRLLHQSRPSRVAHSTASTLRQGPRRWIASALWRRLMVLARALSRGFGFAGPRTGSAVPEAAHRRLDARRGAPLGVLDQKVRHTAIPMMNEAAAPDTPALVPGLLQRIQHNAGVSRAAGTPADKTPDREETGAGRDGGKIGQPQGVRTRCFERPLDAVERTRGRRVADCS